LILTAASRALDDCMSDGAKLEDFLEFECLSPQHSGNDQRFDCAVKIVWNNFTKLRKHAVFQELLDKKHKLAVALLNLSAERQSQMPGGNGDLK
jgi:hypothetical protein